MVNIMENGTKQSVLIVDDVTKNIQLVAKFLTKEGYNLFFAQSGKQALKLAENKAFDLILLDIMMPEMDGFEVCEKLKANEKTKYIPVIFLTAKADSDTIEKAFYLKGVDYITKPFNPSELVSRVRTHLELQLREKKLKESNATKEMLLSIISHDLKTPFYNIKCLAELLLHNYHDYREKDTKKLLSTIENAASHSHSLLENLLDWTRFHTGKLKYKPDTLNLNRSINETLDFLHVQAMNKSILCENNVKDDVFVMADENMLHTILRNLIANAIKYTPAEGKIVVNATNQEGNILVEITDTGVGISKENIEKIFLPGSEYSTRGTNNETGTGFGLMLTKDFVERHGSDLNVVSEVGKGTTFSFYLLKAENI